MRGSEAAAAAREADLATKGQHSGMADQRRAVTLHCVATTVLRTAEVARDLALLDADERQAAQRLRGAEERRDVIAAHALARRLLSAAAPEVAPAAWRFDRTPRGKPFVRPGAGSHPTLPFSLSHSHGLVACAVGHRGEIGLDLEGDARFDVEAVATDVCSADERAQLAGLADRARTARFLDFWTLKEAYAKARGIGIAAGLTRLSFDLRDAGAVVARLPPDAPAGWRFALFRPTPDSRLAVAVDCHDGVPPAIDAALIEGDGSLVPLEPVRIGADRPV